MPAFFNEAQRLATRTAGELAGLQVVRILNEPTAAALAYGAGDSGDECLVVYDLGGGTFDVSVVVAEGGVIEVKASHGDTRLGGDDFDDLLVQLALEKFREKDGSSDSKGGAQLEERELRRLKAALEQAKWTLSDEPFVKVLEEFLSGDAHLDIEIERADYEERIAALCERTLDCVSKALNDAGLSAGQVDKVMMVGGSTRTPLVQRLLSARLSATPHWEIDPDLIVAMGAAVQGATLAGEKPASVLVDITPHTFCTVARVGAFGNIGCVPLIERNSPLPTSKSEAFQTLCDGQESVVVTAYQGESPYPDENSLVGSFRIDDLSDAPAGNTVLINFALDLDGMLKATATEKSTGLSKSMTMDTRAVSTEDLAAARARLAELYGETDRHLLENDGFGDSGGFQSGAGAATATAAAPAVSVASDTHAVIIDEARDMRKRANALLASGAVSDSDRAEIETLLDTIRAAIAQQDWQSASAKCEALSDVVFYLED